MESNEIFKLGDRITILPVIHGSGTYAREVRRHLLAHSADCLAVALPSEFQAGVERGIGMLPHISLCSVNEPDGAMNYVPIDPCQPIIMALRIAMQEGVRREFIDWSSHVYEPRKADWPDPFALNGMPMEKFNAALLLTLPRPEPNQLHDKRARWMAYQLHRLEIDHSRIVFICSILDWPWIREAYNERMKYPQPEKVDHNPELYSIEKKSLYFALSEFPYVTYLYEKNRQDLLSDKEAAIDGIKEILLRARKQYVDKRNLKYHGLTSTALQSQLQYLRNLSILEDRLTPDLYTLVLTAKQVGGDAYAISTLETARDYPFQDDAASALDTINLGMDQAILSDEDGPMQAKNRLSENDMVWRSLDLKPEADFQKQDRWKYKWDPYGQCSWPPEDDKIENFNSHVREQSKLLLSNDLARTEKFTTSVKDGIDIRDTLRHWYTGDIYVKEIPASRGNVEIVVFIFDEEPASERYTWRQTWYAEHNEESTLCFFATEYLDKMVGPGIGQSTYGGCMTIFPPRPIPNIWEDPRMRLAKSLEEKLLEAALFHSREFHVTVVSPTAPKMSWRKLAKHYKKRIIHIPLKRFSNQMLEKIRQFHVLNGKEIRSFARNFIQDM